MKMRRVILASASLSLLVGGAECTRRLLKRPWQHAAPVCSFDDDYGGQIQSEWPYLPSTRQSSMNVHIWHSPFSPRPA